MDKLPSPSDCYADTLQANLDAGVSEREARELARFAGLYASISRAQEGDSLDNGIVYALNPGWSIDPVQPFAGGLIRDMAPVADAIESGGQALLRIRRKMDEKSNPDNGGVSHV